jgi:hypothetical protein
VQLIVCEKNLTPSAPSAADIPAAEQYADRGEVQRKPHVIEKEIDISTNLGVKLK